MEELKKLEEIQSRMMLLQSQHFVSPNISTHSSDSQRFLSQFLIFLREPCGRLSVDDKCNLISQHLPKVSALLVEESLVGLPGENEGFEGDYAPGDQVKEEIGGGGGGGRDLVRKFAVDENHDMALIGLDSMKRANSTLEDFCRSYFMFHGMEVTRPECLFKYLPMLSFTESYIYQLDGLNETIVDLIRSKPTVGDQRCDEEARKVMKTFETEPFRPLLLLLEHHGLLTERIREELKQGEEYWALERKLCSTSEQISIDDVMRAIHLKSFDYRVLNLLLYQLQGEEVNDLHMEFLTVSEFLVEIADDLFDYEVSLGRCARE
ncbi:hypothetical protein RND81_11G222200 [Saponaria officinalis]|uniref:Uncharacterized protein n=2 Tax=Saponaria officinalis TaxID=3572 RepID=A0AAW1HQR5_SAPOF